MHARITLGERINDMAQPIAVSKSIRRAVEVDDSV